MSSTTTVTIIPNNMSTVDDIVYSILVDILYIMVYICNIMGTYSFIQYYNIQVTHIILLLLLLRGCLANTSLPFIYDCDKPAGVSRIILSQSTYISYIISLYCLYIITIRLSWWENKQRVYAPGP